jgi:hypothetical protein
MSSHRQKFDLIALFIQIEEAPKPKVQDPKPAKVPKPKSQPKKAYERRFFHLKVIILTDSQLDSLFHWLQCRKIQEESCVFGWRWRLWYEERFTWAF